MIRLTQTCGAIQVTVQADSLREAIEEIGFFGGLPSACPLCACPLALFHRRPQGYDYYGLRCTGVPSHETTFGIHKDGTRLFYKQRDPNWCLSHVPDDGDGEAPADPPERQNGRAEQAVRQTERQATFAGAAGVDPARCSAPGCGRSLTRSHITCSLQYAGQPLCPAHLKLRQSGKELQLT